MAGPGRSKVTDSRESEGGERGPHSEAVEHYERELTEVHLVRNADPAALATMPARIARAR